VKAKYRSLADYFSKTRDTQEGLAKKLGVTRSYVCLLASGERQPGLKLALRINEMTGVRLESLVPRYREERAS
jgi:transcriptional regulator with XRE-family HTH domain